MGSTCAYRLMNYTVKKNLFNYNKIGFEWWHSHHYSRHYTGFKPKNVVVLTKLTRYEFEKAKAPELSEPELKELLTRRGSDYNTLLYHHNIHKKHEEQVLYELERHQIEAKVVDRFNYKEEDINEADAVITIGGDGTFLLGAVRITKNDKPIIGFNSDPTRSEGYLCLAKKFSSDIGKAFDRLVKGEFRWMYRKRIRITLIGENIYDPPVELHDEQLSKPEYRYIDGLQEQLRNSEPETKEVPQNVRVLPVLGLNEVYIGEKLSARVSYYELSVDNGERVKTKSSGLCLSTGTGSTSWQFNINKLTHQAVANLLVAIKQETGLMIDAQNEELINRITNRFNHSLIFSPELSMMAYTIRDPVSVGTLPKPGEMKPRGFANKVEMKSRCFDAALVIDGGLSFKFNDGTLAIFEMHDDDALKTVVLD
ncbi:NAD kinase 2, mitochondrial-like [Artemia franciscana]|uniref:NAD kinase 2, mitochondrial n=1 Tax=Artemia franciscana TaxID=6661 RepID=A0AA88LE53_ARTSF|nr:hypothetical protein QYM36_005512 [Artemia franciscana]